MSQTAPANHSKVYLVAGAFVLSTVAFVIQTMATSQLNEHNYLEPILLLLLTHGSWWIMWLLQVFVVAVFTGVTSKRRSGEGYLMERPTELSFRTAFTQSVVHQYETMHSVASAVYTHATGLKEIAGVTSIRSYATSEPMRYLLQRAAMVALVLTLAGSTWYISITLTYASDVTAIYNCSTFTTYLFSIPMLHERFEWRKMASVVVAVVGVIIVSYSSSASLEKDYPNRLWGNLIIAIGAILYGYYECLYAKWMSIPGHHHSDSDESASVLDDETNQFLVGMPPGFTPYERATFSNFCTSLLSLWTVVILLPSVAILHFTLLPLKLPPNLTCYALIGASIIANMTFVVMFLVMLSLTSPTIASVASLSTIWFVGLVDWLLGTETPMGAWLGFGVIMLGFLGMCWGSWQEIQE